MTDSILGWILLMPLLGFLINGVFGSKFGAKLAGAIASFAVFVSFVMAVGRFTALGSLDPSQRFLEHVIFQWITVGGFSLPFVLRLDSLSALLCLVVTGVGTLIHVYSIGYMEHDRTPPKFFAYLNLFTFAMLALILGGSLPILFLGWEGVGLCSYLLIGYWYEDDAKASAGKKAFIVNRVGDLGFLLGLFTLFGLFGTLDFQQLKSAVQAAQSSGGIDVAWVTFATLCLFVGAMGKSAQFPLYVWLPDAMAGPTPVSALIHAATMVTAGVYMIARLNFLFVLAPTTMTVVSSIGAFTAFFAATIAVAQTDIKKVLAYSTVSQLGYMFMGVGVGAFTAGVFHLITHAFFKALLFLGSGSVIHGMHEEQDIMKMGGLKKYMPRTFLTFAIGTVAICGIPPLSGFFSKDEILFNAMISHQGAAGPVLWAFGAITALMTAFYMTRMTCLTFFGKPRFDEHKTHPHESPAVMVVPLVILAVLSAVGGFIGIPGASWLAHWLEPVVGAHAELSASEHSLEYILMGVSSLIAVSGMAMGYYLYVLRPELPAKVMATFRAVNTVLLNKYYVDEFYDAALVRPIKAFSVLCWKYVDILFVDGAVLGVARLSRRAGNFGRNLHTGVLQIYAASMLLGLLAIVGYVIYGIR
jgi:NADH-quinone oxidoreductase subunit L